MHALAAVRREIVLRDSCNGRKYLREYTQAFRKYDSVLNSEQLKQRIGAAGILLIGDYHEKRLRDASGGGLSTRDRLF